MAKSTAAADGADARQAIAWIRARYGQDQDLGALVDRFLTTHRLSPDLESEVRRRGLADLAAEHLLSQPRRRILRTITVTTRTDPVKVNLVTVTVRNDLFYWPLGTNHGRILGESTVDDVEREIVHTRLSIEGSMKRLNMLERVVKLARDHGYKKVGRLSDDELETCRQIGMGE
jgi:hypothetical protein